MSLRSGTNDYYWREPVELKQTTQFHLKINPSRTKKNIEQKGSEET